MTQYNDKAVEVNPILPKGGGGSDTPIDDKFHTEDTNTVTFSGDGSVIAPLKAGVKLDPSGNAIQVTPDGLKVGVSSQADNLLSLNNGNLYVAPPDIVVPISAKPLNNIVLESDGLYSPPGEKGDKGEQGEKGEPGIGIYVLGTLTDPANLPPPDTRHEGDTFVIAGHYHTIISGQWVDLGDFRGPQGIQGEKGESIRMKGAVDTLPTENLVAGDTYFVDGKMYTWNGTEWIYSGDFSDKTGGKIYIICSTGQSNSAGANSGGPNPASSKVKVWDGATGNWGSSDYTQAPFSRPNPHGNVGNNNIALAFAHRLVDDGDADQVFLIHDAVGGRPIEDWVGYGVDSVRYEAIKRKVEAALTSPEILATGKTKIDFLVWAQGEENALTDTIVQYRDKFKTLDEQFRAEAWMEATTPMFVMGMSGLHTRYQVWQAQLNYCENYNRNCIYVNSAGLKTQFDVEGAGDYTHWLGPSLWEHGYTRIWQAKDERGVTHRDHLTPFYARGVGPWKGESDAVALFSSLVSIDSATNKFPINAVAATGSITWGLNCAADGNYTLAGGHTVQTTNTCNYSAAWGRDITLNDIADYSAAFGFQHDLNESYQFASGRGHSLQHPNEFAIGRFSKYTEVQTNPVVGQIGIGTQSTRKNAVTVRDDGAVEMYTGSKHDPAQAKEMTFEYVSDTSLKIKMRGVDGTVRSVTLTLA